MSVWERSAVLRSHILPQRSRLGHSSGRDVPSHNSTVAAVSDAECHSLILSCSDALDVVSGGIDRSGGKCPGMCCSARSLGADTIFTCLGSILMKSRKTENV